MSRACPIGWLSAMNMKDITILDLESLKGLLESVDFMQPVYQLLLGDFVARAELRMHPHPAGATVTGKQGRWWVYVRLTGTLGITYDAALWKIINLSTPKIRKKLMRYVQIGQG